MMHGDVVLVPWLTVGGFKLQTSDMQFCHLAGRHYMLGGFSSLRILYLVTGLANLSCDTSTSS